MSPRVGKIMHARTIKDVLVQRSVRSLEIARKQMLAEEVLSEDVRTALAFYATNWKEATHPGVTAFACEAVGGNADSEEFVNSQVALLFLSAAIDIHDDVIDKSTRKNGKLTVFGKFGEEIALLIGNGLLLKGLMVLNSAAGTFSSEKSKEIFSTVKKAFFEVGDAHALELKMRGKWTADADEYLRILKMKAASVEAETRIGAIVGGGTRREVEALGKFGRILGTLSTLREEFVDVFEVQELRNRSQNECLPIPILYAIQDKEIKNRLQKILLRDTINEEDTWKTVEIILKAEPVKKLKKKMITMIHRAAESLKDIKKSNSRDFLTGVVSSMLEDL